MDKALNVRNELKTLNIMALSFNSGTEKGNRLYNRRVSKLRKDLEDINKKESFWDNLKKSKRKETIFEALKKSKRK